MLMPLFRVMQCLSPSFAPHKDVVVPPFHSLRGAAQVAPPDAYRPVRDHFRSHCPWGTCGARAAKGEYPDDYCYTMSAAEVDQLTPMTLHMANGVSIDFGPRQYAYELRAGVWCLGVFDNEHNGAVIGAANMRNHEVGARGIHQP